MITESKVTEIFCIADDFCKEFEVEMAKNALPASPDAPKRRRKRMMSDAEVITILICFHFNSYRNLKHYYLGCVCIHWIRLYCRLKEGYKIFVRIVKNWRNMRKTVCAIVLSVMKREAAVTVRYIVTARI